MQVVNQLLDPRTSEFTAAFVGRLVSTLICRAGTELGEQLDQILRAILSKMQQAETLSVMQVGNENGNSCRVIVMLCSCVTRNKLGTDAEYGPWSCLCLNRSSNLSITFPKGAVNPNTHSSLPSLFSLPLVSDHGVRPPGSFPAGPSVGVLVQSARSDRETRPGVCHDGVDEPATPLLRTV